MVKSKRTRMSRGETNLHMTCQKRPGRTPVIS
jgi:hypothetical protein